MRNCALLPPAFSGHLKNCIIWSFSVWIQIWSESGVSVSLSSFRSWMVFVLKRNNFSIILMKTDISCVMYTKPEFIRKQNCLLWLKCHRVSSLSHLIDITFKWAIRNILKKTHFLERDVTDELIKTCETEQTFLFPLRRSPLYRDLIQRVTHRLETLKFIFVEEVVSDAIYSLI